jgi:hypothetical protein
MPSCRFDANHHGKHSNQSNKDVALHKRIHLETPPLLKHMTQNSEFKPPIQPPKFFTAKLFEGVGRQLGANSRYYDFAEFNSVSTVFMF